MVTPTPLPNPGDYEVREALESDAKGIADYQTVESSTMTHQNIVPPITLKAVRDRIRRPGRPRYYICVDKASGDVVGFDRLQNGRMVINDKDRADFLGVELGEAIEFDFVPMLIVDSKLPPATQIIIQDLLTVHARELETAGELQPYLMVQGPLSCQGAGYIRQLGADEKQLTPTGGEWLVPWEVAFALAEARLEKLRQR